MRARETLPWLGTVLLAAVVLTLVTVWVSAGGINRGEALKTGGLAAGSIVALYALWLNDRRRRTEERRQEIEHRRQELENQRYELELTRQDHDRERVADERFARAVELLGNEADQVRVGALHALAGLARSRPAFTQTVLDVLCSYLRRPFNDAQPGGPEVRGEQQVRRTAQQLITDLLPSTSTPDAPRYDLDLHGASLEYFDLSNRVVGQLRARQTRLRESTYLSGAHVHQQAWFTGARCSGRIYAQNTVFHDRAWFSRVTVAEKGDFTGAEFRGDAKFANAEFAGSAFFGDATFSGTVDFTGAIFRGELDLRVDGGAIARTHAMKVSLTHEVHLPQGWALDRTHGSGYGLVRA